MGPGRGLNPVPSAGRVRDPVRARWSSSVPDDTVARAGARSLRLELEPGRYADTTLRRSFGDWNGYTHLEMSLYNPDEAIQSAITNTSGASGLTTGINGRYFIAPGWNDLRIPITEIRAAPAERPLDLADLSQMVICTVDLEHPRRLYLDRGRLSRGEAP